MEKKKIKEVVIRYADGTEEVEKQGMIATSRALGVFQAEMRLRNFGMSYDMTQNYYIGLMHSIAKLIDQDVLDRLEKQADEMGI